MSPEGSQEKAVFREELILLGCWGSITKYNKLSGLEQQEFIILAVLGAGSLKSICWQGSVPSEGTREGSVPDPSPNCCLLSLWQHNSNLVFCVPACLQISPFYKPPATLN